ncbi:MAG: FtsX-like permease family protein, partial [Firmicutes bacterium]|nr:FtsX-like permease family protein [Bacillota bacterium]
MMYLHLAIDGIRKNRRLYLPYLLTCAGTVFVYYILTALAESPVVAQISGARTTQSLLTVGEGVILVFAAIFLFYTNSFLTRRRQKEFGLYNVLGMSKGNIARILLWETAFTAAFALAGGILSGVALYKLAELALVRIMDGEVTYSIQIVWSVVPRTALTFGTIFLLLFAFTLLKVRLSNPVQLLRSENAGEKPPKANWLLALLGVGILGTGYYIAISIEKPIDAINWFFVAVALVIVGTYLLFIAGSVALCRILQKSKRYYYKPNHFISVSSMAYRMKRNGAGLASICILATMVLVMLSASGSLVASQEEILLGNYPAEISIRISLPQEITDAQKQALQNLTETTAEDYGFTPIHEVGYTYLLDGGFLDGDSLIFDTRLLDNDSSMDVYDLYIVDAATYQVLTGAAAELAEGECLMAASSDAQGLGQITLGPAGTWTVKEEIAVFLPMEKSMISVYDYIMLVVPDLDDCRMLAEEGEAGSFYYDYHFDTGVDDETQIAYYAALGDPLMETVKTWADDGGYAYILSSRAASRADFYSLFGAVFFLGVLLSAVFLCATVLIIYYKQISEGYEDAARFEIMQKVGMTRRDIRKSVNSQMLTVFFLPLVLAGVHVAFAFPIVRKLLLTCGFSNTGLFLTVTGTCFAVFALLYALVYR